MRDISILNTRKDIPIASGRTPKLINIADRTQDNLDSAKLKIAIYSHDTKGLGHMRRNLLISNQISKSFSNSSILLITGAKEINRFDIPQGVDCLTLPSYYKESDSRYEPKSLKVSLDELIKLRTSIIKETIKSYSPDIFIVDYSAKGGLNELTKALKYINRYSQTICVLGLRDILGEPEYILKDWNRKRIFDFIRNYYDYIWIYGDPKVYDMAKECDFPPDITNKISFTGYLGQTNLSNYKEKRKKYIDHDFSKTKIALCVVGGGQDGIVLAEKFAEIKMPSGYTGVLLTGPYMSKEDKDRLRLILTKNNTIKLIDFIPDPVKLFNDAECIISMGGYNTVCELLTYRKKALIVPRINSRKEQLIRVRKLKELKLIDYILPESINSKKLRQWIINDTEQKNIFGHIDLNGLKKLPGLIELVINQKISNVPELGELINAAK